MTLLRARAGVVLLILFAGCAALPRHYVDLGTEARLSRDQFLSRLDGARVIFVGEIHTDPSHHRLQEEIVRHLHGRGRKVHVALEIFPYSRQKVLDRWLDGKLSRRDLHQIFTSTVRLPFEYYEGIFTFARRANIPLHAINAEQDLITSMSRKGPAGVPQEFLSAVGYTACSQEPEYADFLSLGREKELHAQGFPYLCDGQRLRDTVMAYRIADIVDEDITVVVFLGAVHAAKIAVPAILSGKFNLDYRVIMAERMSGILRRSIDTGIADYVWQ